MASTEDDLKSKFESLLKDVENFYADTKDNDESHKVRALNFFSQSEIDSYCQLTFSLYDFNNWKQVYQNKLISSKESLDKLKARSLKLRAQVDQLEKSKLDKSALLDDINASILATEAGIKINEQRITYCLSDINEAQTKLDEGDKITANRESLMATMKPKFQAKASG